MAGWSANIELPKNIEGKTLSPIEAFDKDPYSFATWLDNSIKVLRHQSPKEAAANKDIFPAKQDDDKRQKIEILSAELAEADSLGVDVIDHIITELKDGYASYSGLIRGDDDIYRDIIKEILESQILAIPEKKRNKALADFVDSMENAFTSATNKRGAILKMAAFNKLLKKLIDKQDRKLLELLDRINTCNLPHHQRVTTLIAVSNYLEHNAHDQSNFDMDLAQAFGETLAKLIEREGDYSSKTWLKLRDNWNIDNVVKKVKKFIFKREADRNKEITKVIQEKLKEEIEIVDLEIELFATKAVKNVAAQMEAKKAANVDIDSFKEELRLALETQEDDLIERLDNLSPIFHDDSLLDQQIAALETIHEYLLKQDPESFSEFTDTIAIQAGSIFYNMFLNDESITRNEKEKLEAIAKYWEGLSSKDNYIAKSFVSSYYEMD